MVKKKAAKMGLKEKERKKPDETPLDDYGSDNYPKTTKELLERMSIKPKPQEPKE